MVAVVDILGFKNLVSSKSPKQILEDYFPYLLKAIYSAIHKKSTPGEPPSLRELRDQNYVGFAWFSDTILLYSLEDNVPSYQKLIETVAWLLAHTVGTPELRLRAGIGYGEFIADTENDIYIGKALVEAYQLEKRQEWCGGAFTQTAKEMIPEECWGGKFGNCSVIEYDVPVKPNTDIIGTRSTETYDEVERYKREIREQGETEPLLAIDWMKVYRHSKNSINLLRNIDKSSTDPKDMKLINTQEFHDEQCRWCRKKRNSAV